MRKIYSFLFSIAVVSLASGQALFNNNGADIYVKDGGLVIVKTGSLYNNQIAGVGVLNNSGTVIVEGNVINDGTITAAGDTVRLSGDWINNSVYTSANSWVEMNGGAQQITGTTVTTFNNLNLLGGNAVKSQTLDAVTSGALVLNDAELATDINEMLVTNTNPNAITRNNGFVSSLNTGKLSRNTLASSAYIYPVGSPSSINPPSIFRPIEYSPSAGAANTYGAMVVKGDATLDGYNVTTMDSILCKVNPNFYHRLYHSNGNTATALRMFFDPSTDGEWTEGAHWDLPNRWNNLGMSTAGNGLGLSTVQVSGVNDFQPEPFALARKKFTVDAGPNASIYEGESTDFNPTIGAPTIASVEWTPPISLTCTTCETPTAAPAVTTLYSIKVTDEAGCVASDSLLVKVAPSDFLVPTAFSPNGDGVNDLFHPLNKNLQKLNFEVYNRWGEKVYQTNDPREGWDGVFQSVQQDLGVYVWKSEYQLLGATKSKTASGNVTLVR